MIRCAASNTILIRKLSTDLINFQSFQRLTTCCLVKVDPNRNKNVNHSLKLLNPNILETNFSRSISDASFFNKVSAEKLWASVTGVSNAGKKRGRGKGNKRKPIKDLNRGQMIGVGSANIQWPGLSAPIIRGKELVQQVQLAPDPDREAKLIKLRDQLGRFKALKLTPLERGWSGAKMHGRRVGPPDDIGQDKFEGFDTVILEMKTVGHLDGSLGKIRRFSCFCLTGNKNGLVGLGLAKCPEGKAAIKRAKNRAGQKLLYIPRFQNHTIYHDFFTRYGNTKIFVAKKHEGFGLVCHRVIKSMCELVGIKDLYAKVEGAKTPQGIAKAFLLGLLRQKTHLDLANQKGLYLVEQREDNFNFPNVLGIPEQCRTDCEIDPSETMDFTQYAMDDKVVKKRSNRAPFYMKLPGWTYHLLKTERFRNHYDVRVRLIAEYGGKYSAKSFLTEKYPECYGSYAWLLKEKKIKEQKEAEAAAEEEEEAV